MEDAKRKEKELFEDMPVRKAVLTLAVPTVISQLIVLIYNLADTWFIGQTGDPLQVAAVTVSYPLFMLLGGLGNLFGIGGGSLISRLLGRGRGWKCRENRHLCPMGIRHGHAVLLFTYIRSGNTGAGEDSQHRNVGGRNPQCGARSAVYIRAAYECGGSLQPAFPM